MAADPVSSPKKQPKLGSRDRLLLRDAGVIIGVDEVGRGALAGPVVVCAAAFRAIPEDREVRDSKLLSPRRREKAAARLMAHEIDFAVCEVWPEVIDTLNILEATRLAMRSTALPLIESRAVVVTDHVDPGDLGCPVLTPSKADRDYFSVAAASIIAKVHRDRIMVDLACEYPDWGWEKNKGYGTIAHRRGLELYGRTAFHRRGFKWSPVLP